MESYGFEEGQRLMKRQDTSDSTPKKQRWSRAQRISKNQTLDHYITIATRMARSHVEGIETGNRSSSNLRPSRPNLVKETRQQNQLQKTGSLRESIISSFSPLSNGSKRTAGGNNSKRSHQSQTAEKACSKKVIGRQKRCFKPGGIATQRSVELDQFKALESKA